MQNFREERSWFIYSDTRNTKKANVALRSALMSHSVIQYERNYTASRYGTFE